MQKNQFGLALIVALVALRVGTGMHFFREGLNKLRDPKPFSMYFFSAAKGPLAPTYHNLIWDRDGQARLDADATVQAWDQYRARVEGHYGFDANQKRQAGDVLKRYEGQLRDFLREKADDVREYQGNIARRDKYLGDRQLVETPSLAAQIDRIDAELRGKRGGLLNPIDALWQGLARELNAVANSDQRSRGAVALSKPGRRMIDSESIDKFIPWFDAIIGVLLIAGLFTRPAALAGALFLLSVVASQWPTAAGAMPSWPQFIEALGLLVVAAAGAGRYAGFDSLVSAVCCGCCRRPKQGTPS